MIFEVDKHWKTVLLREIPSPHPEQDFIPFVRYNAPEHGELRERTSKDADRSEDFEGIVYGAYQFLSIRPDFSRRRKAARICKYIDTARTRVRVDRYPTPVFLDYQISLYAEREEKYLPFCTMNLIRRLPLNFYAKIPVDVFGDGEMVDKATHFTMSDGNYRNILDHPKQYQVDIPWTVEAWIFHRTAEEAATFHNRAELTICTQDGRTPVDPDAPAENTDVVTIDVP